MKVDFEHYEPATIITTAEFTKLFHSWKEKQLVPNAEPIAISVEKDPGVFFSKKHKCYYIIFFPTLFWNYQLVAAFIKNVLLPNDHNVFTMNIKSVSERYAGFLQKKKTNYGSIKDILQTGHSMLLNVINDVKDNTFRSFIYADSRNNAVTLTVPYKFLQTFFNIFIDKDVDILKLPDHIALYVKRDPVIWLGGFQVITHLRISHDERNDCVGVSPFQFEAFNMDVDGDTIIGYICFNTMAKVDQLAMLDSNTFMYYGLRWSVSTNHVVAMFFFMLENCSLTLDDLEIIAKQNVKEKIDCVQDLPLFECFQTVLYHSSAECVFGKYTELFEIARSDRTLSFRAILNKIQTLAEDAIEFQDYIIKIMHERAQVALEHSQLFTCVYQNVLYFTGQVTDFELYRTFVDTYKLLPDVDRSLYEKVTDEKNAEFYAYLEQFAITSKQLPLESNTLSMLHTNSSFTYFEDNCIKTLDKVILDNVGDHIPLDLCCIYK